MKKKVIVIGGGIGGLSCAMRLLHHGFDVEIIEKEPTVGGCLNFFKEDGYTFDLTSSILMTPQNYIELFSDLNLNYKDYITLQRLEINYKTFFCDGSDFTFFSNLSRVVSDIEGISKDDSIGYFTFMRDYYKKYLYIDDNFLNRSFLKICDKYGVTTLKNSIKSNPFTTSYNNVSKYIKSQKLKDFLLFQTMYIGISPFKSPNIYNVIPAISQIYGLWYIRGGMYSYVNAICKVINELGGKISTMTNACEIIHSKDKVCGIRTSSGVKRCDICVSNADYLYSNNVLLKDNTLKNNDFDLSCSVFILYLALKEKIPSISVHNIFLNSNFKESIQEIFDGFLPTTPSLYVYSNSKIDDSVAPAGCDSLNIMMRVPNLKSKIIWDDYIISKVRNLIIDTLKTIEPFKNIESLIKFERYLTPKDLSEKFNFKYGCAFGISHTLSQSSMFRPQVKSKPFKNLYFVGSNIHPGVGVSNVLLCSKLVADAIIKCDKS